MAEKRGLVTAKKKESMGICFVGKVGIKEFLSQYVETEPGPVLDQYGVEVGRHEGAIFYTIGQRHGLDVGGGMPYYVTRKDMATNTVYVTTDLNDKHLWTNTLKLEQLHWISTPPAPQDQLKIRTRHRAELIPVSTFDPKQAVFTLKDEIRAVTPGQSAVIYRSSECLGGGIIS
jgi:tRNA-specific 2-thiouridylase